MLVPASRTPADPSERPPADPSDRPSADPSGRTHLRPIARIPSRCAPATPTPTPGRPRHRQLAPARARRLDAGSERPRCVSGCGWPKPSWDPNATAAATELTLLRGPGHIPCTQTPLFSPKTFMRDPNCTQPSSVALGPPLAISLACLNTETSNFCGCVVTCQTLRNTEESKIFKKEKRSVRACVQGGGGGFLNHLRPCLRGKIRPTG